MVTNVRWHVLNSMETYSLCPFAHFWINWGCAGLAAEEVISYEFKNKQTNKKGFKSILRTEASTDCYNTVSDKCLTRSVTVMDRDGFKVTSDQFLTHLSSFLPPLSQIYSLTNFPWFSNLPFINCLTGFKSLFFCYSLLSTILVHNYCESTL